MADDAARARELYDQAWARHQQDRHAEALELVEQAVALDPACPNAHNLAGWLLFRHLAGRPGAGHDAIAHFEEARRRFPEDPTPLCNLADALLAAGAAERAVALMTEAAERGPGYTPPSRADNWLGWYHLHHTGDLPAALAHLRRAVGRAPWWAPALEHCAIALEATGDLGAASDHYLRALRAGGALDPARVLSRLGAIARERGRPRRALSWFRRSLHVERERGGARVAEIEGACAALEQALTAAGIDFPAAATEQRWLEADLRAERLADGVDVRAGSPDPERLRYTRLLERDEPDPEPGPTGPIAALVAHGNHEEALAALAELQRTDPGALFDHAGITERAGDDARLDGDLPLARRYYDLTHDAYAWHASGASAGGEGLARMVDVDRLRRKLEGPT